MIIHPFFSYYGAKWQAAKHYPSPLFDTIIEPFAGSAGYALHYTKSNVHLNDLDPLISEMWKFLVKATPDQINDIPDKVLRITDIRKFSRPQRTLVGYWLNKGSAKPVKQSSAWMRTGKWNSQFWGPEIKKRIIRQLPAIRRWRITGKDYRDLLTNKKATWFIDPPYEIKGKHYTFNEINYQELGEWCRSLPGQIIVCEQHGATWLPFKPFRNIKALKQRQSLELLYTRPAHQLI